MRSRLAIVLASVVIVPVATVALGSVARASSGFSLAQSGGQSSKATPGPQSGGSKKAGANGAQPSATPTPGPPWTYQMARISVVLLVLMIAGVAGLYYRLVIARQRGEV
ncbi:MAG: hypothetical protein M3P18_22595 [Actinomycetota bacterium]|nr:hypothetical protein [Actinomycetota bacterium]